MLGSALIVFREVLEAALIIGIVLAATRGIAQRGAWVAGGVVAGALGAVLVALGADRIASAAEGYGQEMFNAAALLLAVALLAWHQIWMSQHGREIARQMNDLGQSVKQGGTALHMLAVVVGLAMLREGSEAALFLFGVAASDALGTAQVLTGALIGLAGGAVCGGALYLGLLRVAPRRLFQVTGWLMVLLAAAMASQAAAFLVQAGALPPLVDEVWNSSALLERHGAMGQLLHIMVGYDDRPSGMQLTFYAITVVTIFGLTRRISKQPTASANPVPR
ncbi:MAG: FTR1 family iron permease [Rhodoferax sp.]